MSKILFVVGPPGVGKTTLVRLLLTMQGPELPIGGYLVAKPKWTVIGKEICAAGHYTGQVFDGGDTVPYTGAMPALDYWRANLSDRRLTVLDGDRFSFAGVVTALRGHDLACLHVEASLEILDARRAARGSKQNATWMKGRESKARNFAAMFAPENDAPVGQLFKLVDEGAPPGTMLATFNAMTARWRSRP